MKRSALACTTLLALATTASVAVAVPSAASADGHPAARVPVAGHHVPGRTTGVDPAALAHRSGALIHPLDRGSANGTLPRRVLDPQAAALRAGRNGKVSVSVAGARSVVAARVRDLGGQVLATAGGVSSVLVAKSRLTDLAATAGISAVRSPIRPHIAAGPTSEGVQASQADAWQTAGTAGSGITIGIVDAGFTGLAAAEKAGDLPDDVTVVNEDCSDGGTPSTETSVHGTAVAEIAHQMAPAAGLALYCVGTNVGFAAAAADIQAHNADSDAGQIKIVSSSLGFSDDGRGDGTGTSSGDGISTAYAVRQARRSGILWIQSAGNNAENHWSGKLTDADKDKLVDIDGVYNEDKDQYEDDVSFVAGAADSGPSFADIELQWDQWPTTNSAVTLQAFGFQCTDDFSATDGSLCGEYPITADANGIVHKVPGVNPAPTPTTIKHTAGTAPYAEIDMRNTSKYEQYWVVYIGVTTAYPTVRYDLTYQGDVDGPSALACVDPTNTGCTSISPRSYQGSISAPASSPYALAVGAADVGADGVARGTLEPFSSQGPTIDGRAKPEITAWDGVSSPVYGSPTDADPGGFYGTSAAAPHVAGAAALALQADPDLDAAQLQTFLEQRANSGSPANPPTNQKGHGLLTLGDTPATTPVSAPAGARYTAVTPARLLDTRTTTGGHKGVVAAGKTVTVKLPSTIPDDATAVAVNLTGTGATATTYLSAYPGGTAAPAASNLNLSKTDPTAAVFAVVRINANRSITVINNAGSVNVVLDEVGYFAPGDGPGLYDPLASATRVLDTRTTTGGHKGKLAPGKSVTVQSGSGAGQVAAIVNITATNVGGTGYLSAGAACGASTSTLNFTKYTRANLAVVELTPAGTFCVTAGGNATDVAIDVVGYMGTTGAEFHALPSATRIVDTRTGNGGAGGGRATLPLAAAKTTAFYGANVGDVPADSTALLTGVVEASTTTGQYLALFPGATKPASVTSNLNFSTGRVVPNAAVVGLSSAHQFGVYNNAGSTNVAIDVFGYFSPGAAG